MRNVKYMAVLAALALLVPVSVLARSKNEHSIAIRDTVQVGSTQLKAGTYKVEWQGTGPALQVNFLENGKAVATAQGKMVEKSKPSPYDDIVTRKAGNAQKLEEIDFGGQKGALVLASNQNAGK